MFNKGEALNCNIHPFTRTTPLETIRGRLPFEFLFPPSITFERPVMHATVNKLAIVATLAILTGCASVPMAPKEQDAASKSFKTPSAKMAGVYIYRNSSFGGAIKKAVKIDNVVIGETAKYTYFHKEVSPGAHVLATQSEFGDNVLNFTAEEGKNYYFRQYMKLGAFVAGSGLEAVSEADRRAGVLECGEAK
ncbi:MAG TPA: DUF2846 domain-containing protein [Sideroxyarcus sp.]|nr:DUF2846 domain-containing protein [Sideroxyarcus sp.]